MVSLTRTHALKGLRLTAPFVVAALCLGVLLSKVEADVLSSVPQHVSQLSGLQIMAAILATVISFWAVGRYDVVTHRALGTGISAQRAQIAGTSAIALSQTLGFGVFTAAIARWRLLPDLSLVSALRVSAFVSVSFIFALALVCALVWLALPMPAWVDAPALLVLLSALGLVCAVLLRPDLTIGRFHQIRLPTLATCGAIFGWTLIDTCAAALALYLLIPSAEIGLSVVLPAYLLALGAGLISGAPGGVGPFELALLSVMPHGVEAEVLAGALAFRVLYYAVPAALAGLALIRPLPAPAPRAPANPPVTDPLDRPAELGVLRQNNGKIAIFDQSVCAIWPTPQALCMMFDPLAGHPKAAMNDLHQAAKAQNKVPVLYKITGRSAFAARQMGWQVVHVADEAVLHPARFDLTARGCRDLRRKLRQAEKAGLRVVQPNHLPTQDMADVDAQWQSAHGTARGGSMGRFCPKYLTRQKVFLAYQGPTLVGFISLHRSADEWCLDLMRHIPGTPRGTMQLLVKDAIVEAGKLGIPRFSLACAPPTPPASAGPLMRRSITGATKASKTAGLRRFKSGFSPIWEPRYAAAPGPVSLALALFDIARSIYWPPVLGHTNRPHKEDEECEVVLQLTP